MKTKRGSKLTEYIHVAVDTLPRQTMSAARDDGLASRNRRLSSTLSGRKNAARVSSIQIQRLVCRKGSTGG